MSHYIEKVTVSLENLISELARNPSLFLKNPDTDFSRNRKINFKTCVGITMNSGGCTLNKELLDFFDFDVNAPTVSAYTQQRAKILPEAFEYLFHAFTEENAQTKNLYEGYQLLACDGSNLTIAPNLNDPETLWKSNQLGATGNHLHLNALYDVLNRTYCHNNQIAEGLIFVTKNGKLKDRSNIWREMKRLKEKAGVAESKIFPHNFRHLFARIYYKVTKDITGLADLLGHSSINVTRIYTATTETVFQKKLDKIVEQEILECTT